MNSGAIPYKTVYLLFVLPNENFAAISLSKTFFGKSPRDRYRNCNFHEKKSFSNTIRSLHWGYSLYCIKVIDSFMGFLINWSHKLLTNCITLCFLTTLLTSSENHPYINCWFSCTYQRFAFGSSSMWLQGWNTHYWHINTFSANYATCFWGLISLYYPLWIFVIT